MANEDLHNNVRIWNNQLSRGVPVETIRHLAEQRLEAIEIQLKTIGEAKTAISDFISGLDKKEEPTAEQSVPATLDEEDGKA